MHLLLLLACTDPTDGTPVDDTGTPLTGDSIPTETDTDPGTTPTGLDPDDLDTLRRRIERDLNGLYASGASVALWKDGAVVFAEGFGSADPDAEVAITPETLFQVGSDTKKMTAIAVLQQVAAGTLSLDQTVASALPDVELARSPEWNDAATLHQLLSHQGGLNDYTPWDDDPADEVLRGRATGEFSDREWAMNPGGAFWNYANPNFSLLGLAAEEAAGIPYPDLLVDGVFAPLGMDHTYAREADMPASAPIAVGYGINLTGDYDWFDPWGDTLTYTVGRSDLAATADNGFTRPAGLVWSTPSDMCTLAGFLIEGNAAVLDDSLRAEITTAHVPLYPSDPTQGYGYGMFVVDFYPDSDGGIHDTPFWLHGGNTLGYTSTFYVVPELDFAVCILSNGYGDDFSKSAYKAIDLFAGVPAETFELEYPPYEVAPETLAGHYVDPELGDIDVTWVKDHLEIAIPRLVETGHVVQPVLTQAWREVWYVTVDGYDYDVSFIDGEDGTPSKYIRNRQFVGTRTD